MKKYLQLLAIVFVVVCSFAGGLYYGTQKTMASVERKVTDVEKDVNTIFAEVPEVKENSVILTRIIQANIRAVR